MLTLKLDDVSSLIANFRAFDRRYQRDVRSLNRDTAADALSLARQLCPKDTTYMSTQLKMDFSDEGLRWSVGWHIEDFIGQINPFDGSLITVFYPPLVEGGTLSSPAQPTLEPTMATVRPEYLRELRELTRESVSRFKQKAA